MRQLDVKITVDQLEAKRRLAEVDASIASLTEQFKAGGLTTTQYADKLRALNTTTTAATKETQAYSGSQDKLGQIKTKTVTASDQLTSAVTRYITVLAVVGAIKKTLDYAASLEKMKAATDISYKGLQQLENIGASTNTTVEAMTLGIQDLQKRLALGEDSAVGAIKKLGINLQAFMELSPDEQFYAIARALKDHNDKAGLASQLFRNWKEIMPALTSDVDALKDSVRILGDESIQSAAKTETWFTLAWTAVKRLGLEAISAKYWLDRIDPGLLLHGWGGSLPTPPSAPDLSGALPSPFALDILSGTEASQSHLTAAVNKHIDALEKAAEAQKTFDEAVMRATSHAAPFADLIETIDGRVVEGAKHFLSLGASVKDVGTMYGLTEGQAEALAEQLKFQRDAIEKFGDAVRSATSYAQPFYAILNTIDGRVLEGAKHYLAYGASLKDVALMYDLSEGQIEAVVKQMTLEALIVQATRQSYDQLSEQLKDTAQRRQEVSEAGALTNLQAQAAALSNFHDIQQRLSLTSYEYQRDLILREQNDKKLALDKSAEFYSDALSAINAETKAMLAEITPLWGGVFDAGLSALSRIDAQWARTAERMVFDIKEITRLWKSGDRAGAVGAGLIMAGNLVPTDTTAGSIASGALAGAGAGAAIGAPYAAATLGLSVAVGAGVGALIGWYKSEKAAKQVNDTRDAFLSQNGELGKLHQHLVQTLGPMGDLLTQQLLAAKNSHEWAAATQAVEDALAAYTQKVETAKVEILGLGASFSAIVAGSTRSAETIGDLGTIAVATYAAMTEAGYSHEQAIAASHDGLQLLREAYATLGLKVEDTALQMLLVADAINTNNPALVAGVGALASQFEILSKYGLLNVDTFDAMQRTGMEMYTRLQDEVSRVGGSTRDALVPMQQYLHNAEDAALALGIPLDANTQMLIDQSKELGIWKDKGKDANQLLLEGIDKLVKRMDDLISRLNNIPNPSFTVTGNYIPPPNLPGGDGTEFPGYHSGGVVLPFIPRAHRGLAIDEVPIIAQTGEGILNRGAMRRLGRGGFDRINAGGGLGTTVVVQPGAVVVHSVIESPSERHQIAAAIADDIQRELDLRTRRSA